MKSIGFGLERIAWLALRWPLATAAALVLILAVCAFGLTRLAFDEDLRNTFASTSSAYDAYVAATAEFVDPENETIVLVEGERLGAPDVFPKLEDFQFELQLLPGVGSVYSLFALRDAPDATGDAPLVVRDSSAGLTPALAARIRAHPVLGGKLLSPDDRAMVFVVTPAEKKAPLATARVLNAEVEKAAATVLEGTGLAVSLTGYPAIRIAIVDILKRDQYILNGVGALIGFVMSLIAFRSFIAAILTAAPAVLAGLAVLGGMGLVGVEITVMSNVIPTLVMILGYADGMHLSHAWRKHRDEGKSPRDAEWAAQRDIGAACMLTAIIVGLAFAALAITDIALVRDFAWTGAVAMVIACPIVLTGHALGVLLIGRYWQPRHGAIDLLDRLEEPSARLGAWVVRRARPLALVSALLFVVFGALYAAVPPAHSVREHLPANNAANAALGRYDANFGGAFPIQIVLPARDESGLTAERLQEIGAVQNAAAGVAGVTTPLSVWSLYEWVGGPGDPAAAKRLETVLAQLPPETLSRFIGARTGAALVTVNVQEAESHVLETRFRAIEDAVRAVGVDDAIVTGVTVVTNREASRMISDLNWSLATAIFGDILILVVAFRNIPIGIVSTLANTMPLFATGALLWLTGHGMQFTSVIALTVAFGIAVDDTIHYLNRFLILQRPADPLDRRLVATSREIGPVLIGTTVIILGGLSTTFTSGLPSVTLFGMIASITLVIAMAGDLVVMPALIAGYARRWFDRKAVAVDEPETSERV